MLSSLLNSVRYGAGGPSVGIREKATSARLPASAMALLNHEHPTRRFLITLLQAETERQHHQEDVESTLV